MTKDPKVYYVACIKSACLPEDMKLLESIIEGYPDPFWSQAASTALNCCAGLLDSSLTYDKAESIVFGMESRPGLTWEQYSEEIGIDFSEYLYCKALVTLRISISDMNNKTPDGGLMMLCHSEYLLGRAVGNNNPKDDDLIFRSVSAKYGAMGGNAYDEDRDDFKETYRIEREACPDESRPTIIDKLAKREKVKRSTLERWAKEADNEDGFIRKGGRPPKKR